MPDIGYDGNTSAVRKETPENKKRRPTKTPEQPPTRPQSPVQPRLTGGKKNKSKKNKSRKNKSKRNH